MANGAETSTARRGKRRRGRGPNTVESTPSGLRTDPTVVAGPVLRYGEEESRRMPAGGTAENAGVPGEPVDAEDGGLRACPSVDRSAAPRLLADETSAG